MKHIKMKMYIIYIFIGLSELDGDLVKKWMWVSECLEVDVSKRECGILIRMREGVWDDR